MEREIKTYDARIHHPFTAIVNGPSGAGKTTFVHKMLLDKDVIDTTFDKIYIFIGTPLSQNKIFTQLSEALPGVVEIIYLQNLYPNLKKSKFTEEMTSVLNN